MSTPDHEPGAPTVVSALAQAVEARRLSDPSGAQRRSFTVSRVQALLELRRRPQEGPWHWTVRLLRAANVLSRRALATVEHSSEGDVDVTELRFSAPGADFEALDLTGFLGAALEIDGGPPLGTVEDPAALVRRWRTLVAAAINDALAWDPVAVEVLTPRGARSFERVERAGEDVDPYRERSIAARCTDESFAVRIRLPRRGLGDRFADLLRGASDVVEHLDELWRGALVDTSSDQGLAAGLVLWSDPVGRRIDLGGHARWYLARTPRGTEPAGPWLIRDGVRMGSIASALDRAGLRADQLGGLIECPTLRRTADDQSVVHDAELDLLVAWLRDALEHVLGRLEDSDESDEHDGWPARLSSVATVAGESLSLDEIGRRAARGHDFLYVWTHQARLVRNSLRTRVLSLWPSEHALLLRAVPDVQLVPIRALGETPELSRADLTSLAQGSLPPLRIEMGSESMLTMADGVTLRLELTAYVHRYPTAKRGVIVLLAYGRRVAQLREEQRVVPGVTLVCHVQGRSSTGEPPAIDQLRERVEDLRAVATHCREVAEREMESLLAHVFRGGNPWESPLARTVIDELTGSRLKMRYSVIDGQIRLTWRETALLELAVGRTLDGGVCTLRDALTRCRDVGGIVVGDPTKRWRTLESGGSDHAPWELTEHGRAVIERVVSRAVLWDMPTVPEAHPHVAGAAQQPHLRLGREEVARLLGRSMRDPHARSSLLAHLLVVEALDGDGDGFGLEQVALLPRYDPRAVAPARLVTLQTARTERPLPRLVFPGAVGRGLAGPVIEATPGEALLLHAVAGFEPAAVPERGLLPSARTGEKTAPTRRRGQTSMPLVSLPIVHGLAAGSLRLEADPVAGGVGLWEKGVQVGTIRLPKPLNRAGGRLWLTKAGAAVGKQRLVVELRKLTRELVRAALSERALLTPGSARRAKLDQFIEDCLDEVLNGSDDLDLGSVLGAGSRGPDHYADVMTTLERDPLKPLPRNRQRWLTNLVRQALQRPVAIDTAWLSWSAAKLENHTQSGRLVVELGRRHHWIQRTLVEQPQAAAVFETAALVVAEILVQGRARELPGWKRGAEDAAFYRLLAMAYAHLG